MEIKGIPSATATLMMMAPKKDADRLVFECDIFADQDDEADKMKLVEKHKSNVIRGNKAACIVQKMMDKYNVTYVDTKGNREKAVLGSYADIYKVAETVHGEAILEFCFSIIENAGWNNEANGYATYIIRALKMAWSVHQENREEIFDFLSTELRQFDPELFSAVSRARYPKRDYRAAAILYLEDMLVSGLALQRRVYLDEEKNYIVQQ